MSEDPSDGALPPIDDLEDMTTDEHASAARMRRDDAPSDDGATMVYRSSRRDDVVSETAPTRPHRRGSDTENRDSSTRRAVLAVAPTWMFGFGAAALVIAAVSGWYAGWTPLLLYLFCVVPLAVGLVVVIGGSGDLVRTMTSPWTIAGALFGTVLCAAWIAPTVRGWAVETTTEAVARKALTDADPHVAATACAHLIRVEVTESLPTGVVEHLDSAVLAECVLRLDDTTAERVSAHVVRRFERALTGERGDTPSCEDVGILQAMPVEEKQLQAANWACVVGDRTDGVRECCATALASNDDDVIAWSLRTLDEARRNSVAAWLLAASFHETGLTASDRRAAGILDVDSTRMRENALDLACIASDASERGRILKHARAAIASHCPGFDFDGVDQMDAGAWRRVCRARRERPGLCAAARTAFVHDAVLLARGLVAAGTSAYDFGSKTDGIHDGFVSETRESQQPASRLAELADRIEALEDPETRQLESEVLEKMKRQDVAVDRLEAALREPAVRDRPSDDVSPEQLREIRRRLAKEPPSTR